MSSGRVPSPKFQKIDGPVPLALIQFGGLLVEHDAEGVIR
jgi:hypothetical protein